jgi:hypothetical protein
MRRSIWIAVLGGLAVGALTASGAFASRTMAPMKFSASLNIKQEVPKEVGAPAMAAGKFTGVVTGTTLKWTLTFSHLTGPATAAHIHLGAKGKAGAVIIPLCTPCKVMESGSAKVTTAEINDMTNGKTYVNVHTAKNPGGEIRGQVM